MENAVDRFLNKINLTLPVKVAIVGASLTFLFLIGEGAEESFGPFLAYLYGSIPFGYLITKYWTGKNITAEGSGNVGMANSYNVGGMVPAIVTTSGEISKALLPLTITFLYYDLDLRLSCFLLAGTYLGTNFSIFLKGKGGMGTTMMLWSLLVLSPLSLVAILACMVVTMKVMKDTYHMALLNYAIGPFIVFIIDGRPILVTFVTFAAMIYLIKLKRDMDDLGVRHRMMSQRRSGSF
ncbi:MAG: glycerol-3-phosphate acyltransferase [Methanomassiliicoccales archaeon]|nr:MAG: glycerol-3-phosphate acyltransferase [Methanomassiliicoccales archaeon]